MSSLIRLENYAVLCYAGFGKILKKFDRRTGFTTRTPFMQQRVNAQRFAT
jgi:hypothetical protein